MTKTCFNIKSNYLNVVPTSKLIRQALGEYNIVECDGKEIEICFMEALNNVIKHAYKNDHDKDIEIELFFENNMAEIKISDYGSARENKKVIAPKVNPRVVEKLPESGMGLYVIEQLMDNTEYFSVNGKNTFIMKRKCRIGMQNDTMV